MQLIDKSKDERMLTANKKKRCTLQSINHLSNIFKSEMKKELRRMNRRRQIFGLSRIEDTYSKKSSNRYTVIGEENLLQENEWNGERKTEEIKLQSERLDA
jgi:hypothetical protein